MKLEREILVVIISQSKTVSWGIQADAGWKTKVEKKSHDGSEIIHKRKWSLKQMLFFPHMAQTQQTPLNTESLIWR